MDDLPQGILFPSESKLKRLWLSPAGLRSYHTDRSAGYNEDNRGFGAEYDVSPIVKLATGAFRNSIDKTSDYLGAALLGTPFSSLPELRAGTLLGAINGYPDMRHGSWFPMAIPMLSYEGKNFGTNVMALPKIGDISPVIAAQMKFRF
jgi:hypothetical protein